MAGPIARGARRVALLLAALLVAPAPVRSETPASPTPAETSLFADWNRENALCRGGSGDDPATMAACERREAVDRALDRQGWCYGREGEIQAMKEWHRCGPGSIRLTPPASLPPRS